MKKPTLRQQILWAVLPALAMLILIVAGSFYHHYNSGGPEFGHATLVIKHPEGGAVTPFDVELALTSSQQAYGLMFRKTLAPNNGMLFVWDKEQTIHMWMKNTRLPLDMLFVTSDGTIEKIAKHAIPFDLSVISSYEPVKGVIEIGGDEADRLGIRVGDKVLYPAFGNAP